MLLPGRGDCLNVIVWILRSVVGEPVVDEAAGRNGVIVFVDKPEETVDTFLWHTCIGECLMRGLLRFLVDEIADRHAFQQLRRVIFCGGELASLRVR